MVRTQHLDFRQQVLIGDYLERHSVRVVMYFHVKLERILLVAAYPSNREQLDGSLTHRQSCSKQQLGTLLYKNRFDVLSIPVRSIFIL